MSTLSTPTPAPTPAGFAGTWDIDPAHTEVGFSVRHLMVSRLRGRFGTFSGTFTIGADAESSSVAVTVDLASIDTNHADRDAHLRSADFFSVDQHPTMTYRSTAVRPEGDDWAVEGGGVVVGHQVSITLEVEGVLRPA